MAAREDQVLAAVLDVGRARDVRAVLRRTVARAARLVGAVRGAAGVVADSGRLVDFEGHGLTRPDAAQPRARDLALALHALTEPGRYDDVAAALREQEIASDRLFSGFGIVLEFEADGGLHGRLLLSRDDAPFTTAEERVLQRLLRGTAMALANARAFESSERRRRFLESTASIHEALAPLTRVEEGLALIARAATRILNASAVAVLELRDGERPDIAAVAGVNARAVPDVLFRISPDVLTGLPEADIAFVPEGRDRLVVLVPFNSHLSMDGMLLCLLEGDGIVFRYDEAEALGTFADQVALALDRMQAVTDRQELMLVSDRDRIARDLHDVVIQRLFATGLHLQGTRRFVSEEEARQRLDSAVADLDLTISDIRTTIFNLQRPTIHAVRDEIREVVKEYIPLLGYTPLVRTSGPVDSVVPREVGEQLLAVLREALSNIMKHARASAAVVELEATGSTVTLRVTDDGVGLPAERRDSGLRNMDERARALDGELRLEARDPTGTILEWTVPLAAT